MRVMPVTTRIFFGITGLLGFKGPFLALEVGDAFAVLFSVALEGQIELVGETIEFHPD